jgi:hypothetical protein
MPETSQIIYTKIDEAPALASHSLLPILRAFTKGSGIELEAWDISLTGRIISPGLYQGVGYRTGGLGYLADWPHHREFSRQSDR